MSAPSAADSAKGRSIREVLFFALAAVIFVMFGLGYWALHREPPSPQSNERDATSNDQSNARYAITVCRERAQALPAGSDQAQIAREACQLMQTQYDQTYRLAP